MKTLTQHAVTRMQQRGIKEHTIDCLMNQGARTYDHRGCRIYTFDKQSRQRLKTLLSEVQFRQLEAQMDTYAVISSLGHVVTVGHRTKRINRH